MPTFRFSASDRSGKEISGTVQAANADEAMHNLIKQGLRLKQIIAVPDGTPTTKQPDRPTPPRPVQQQPRPQIQQPQRSTQGPIVTNRAAPPAQQINTLSSSSVQKIRTPKGSDKDRYFLFSQISQFLKAGVNPAQAFTDLAAKSRSRYKESLDALGRAAMEGIPLSTVMERYPDLYPEHVVGQVRAGENGGFLPDACMLISDQAFSAHKFKRWYWWVWALAINALLAIPGMWLVTRGLLRAWEIADKTGGEGGFNQGLSDVTQGIIDRMRWPVGPITLGVWLLLIALWRYLSSGRARRFRHQLALKWPAFGPRSKHENLTIFAWTMGKLSRAGLAPKRSWELAAAAVPNLIMRERLMRVGDAMTGAEKVSEAVFREEIFPDEYAPVVATAEMTGDMEGAFNQLSEVSRTEFETAQNYTKLRSGCWGFLGCFVTSGIMMMLLWGMWYIELPAKILQGFEPGP